MCLYMTEWHPLEHHTELRESQKASSVPNTEVHKPKRIEFQDNVLFSAVSRKYEQKNMFSQPRVLLKSCQFSVSVYSEKQSFPISTYGPAFWLCTLCLFVCICRMRLSVNKLSLYKIMQY